MNGRLVHARYVPRSSACPPCEHLPHASLPPRRRDALARGARHLVVAVAAAGVAWAWLVLLLSGGSR